VLLAGVGGPRGPIGAIEAVPLELDGNSGEDLADLFLIALGADGDGVVVEGLLLREVVTAVLATVMIGRHRSFPPLVIVLYTSLVNTHILAVLATIGGGF